MPRRTRWIARLIRWCFVLGIGRRQAILLSFICVLVFMRKPSSAVFDTAVNPRLLVYPKASEDVGQYLHSQARSSQLPVYVFYPTVRLGQLNNQIIALINALCIARTLNATLVTPAAHYGAESERDWSATRGWPSRLFGTKRDALVGDYLDAELINEIQPVIDTDRFLTSLGGVALARMRAVLVRQGDAEHYWSMLHGRIRITGRTTIPEIPPDARPIASRREVDCYFGATRYLRGVPYRAGVNANYFFLPAIFRSHALNCTSVEQHWTSVRANIQPVPELRYVATKEVAKWGTYVAVHLRFLPYDVGKFHPRDVVSMLTRKHGALIDAVNYVYVAYSPGCQASRQVVQVMHTELKSKIRTVTAFGQLDALGPAFRRKYSATMLDMWVSVLSTFFIGRRASSLSSNVVYWRQVFKDRDDRKQSAWYKLEDFSYDQQSSAADALFSSTNTRTD